MRTSTTFITACALLLGLSACGSSDEPVNDPPAASSDLATELVARTGFISTGVEGFTLVPDTEVRIAFDDNGTLGANAGCNSTGGEFTIDGSTLVVSDLFSTEMGCDSELQAQDQWLAALLTSRPTVTLDGDVLTIAGADSTLTLLDATVAEPALPLESTVWTVDGLIDGETASSVPAGGTATLTISDGRATIKPGCNSGSAEVTVGDGVITFGPIALTRMACEPDLMQLESFVTSVLTGDVSFTIEANRLTITSAAADGRAIGLDLRAEP